MKISPAVAGANDAKIQKKVLTLNISCLIDICFM